MKRGRSAPALAALHYTRAHWVAAGYVGHACLHGLAPQLQHDIGAAGCSTQVGCRSHGDDQAALGAALHVWPAKVVGWEGRGTKHPSPASSAPAGDIMGLLSSLPVHSTLPCRGWRRWGGADGQPPPCPQPRWQLPPSALPLALPTPRPWTCLSAPSGTMSAWPSPGQRG